ncbi:MAG: autotransporter domain-containing protein [Xanthobacteraceae bacterium]
MEKTILSPTKRLNLHRVAILSQCMKKLCGPSWGVAFNRPAMLHFTRERWFRIRGPGDSMGSSIDISGVRSPINRPRSHLVVWLAVLGVMSLLWSHSPARAQFVCSTSGTTQTCTNSGTSGTFALATTTQNATVNNSGTVNGSVDDFSSAGGNASTTNSGTVTQFVQVSTNGGGAASATNSGTVGTFLQVFTNGGGNASATNSGPVGTDLQVFTNAGGNASATNSGSVGTFLQVFTNAGGSASVTNSGPVGQYLQVFTNAGGNASATSSGSVGQFLQVFAGGGGGNATATNSGSVGQFMQAFTQGGGNASGTNSGSVALFMQVFTEAGGTASATNSGTVGQAFQVGTSAGGNASATNSGTVGQAFTVDTLAGGNASATNSGSVFGGAVITALGGGNSSLTNSGLITNTMGGPAIQFVGGPDTLTNVVGSRVIGAIDLVGVHDTVNFVGGNWLYTFNTLAGATINTNGAPFVVSGNTVAVLDQTAFALADRSLMNFTGGVSQMLRDRLYSMPTGVAGGQAAMSFAAPDSSGIAAQAAFAGFPSVAMAYASDARPILGKAPAVAPYYDTTVWASGFAGTRLQDANGPVLAATDTAYGAAIGVDRTFASNVRLGAFIGGGFGQEAVEFNTQTINTNYFYGGLYGHVDWAAQFLDFALYGGGMGNNSTRGVADNLVPGGFGNATGSYGGWFLSPELIYGIHIPMNDYVLTPRATVRYVGGVLDGYTETGSAQNLTVGQQAINDVEERIEVEFSKVMPVSFGGTVKTTGSVGAIGLERIGNPNINTILLGQNLSFVTPGLNDAIGAVFGAGFQYRPTASVSLYVNAEGTVMSDKSVSGAVTGGARVAF